MNKLYLALSAVVSLGIGIPIGGGIVYATSTVQLTCPAAQTAAVERPSHLFETQPVPLTGYKSY